MAADLSPEGPGPAGQALGESARVDVALVGIEQARDHGPVVVPERVHLLHLGGRHELEFKAEAGGDAHEMMEMVDPVRGVAGPERSGVAVGDGIVGIGRQLRVQAPRIVAGSLPEPTVGTRRYVPGRVPGRAGSQFMLLEQNGVGAPGLGEMGQD